MFSLNSLNSVTKILYFKKIIRTCYKTQVAERIFELISCITDLESIRFIRFPEFAEFTEFLIHLGKTPLLQFGVPQLKGMVSPNLDLFESTKMVHFNHLDTS